MIRQSTSVRKLAASLLAAFVLAAGPSVSCARERNVVDIPNNDPDMAAAKAKARASLPTFWDAYAAPKPNEQGFALKIGIRTRGWSTEHIWVSDVKRLSGSRLAGRFANEPEDLPGKHAGDAVDFGDDQISDWMFLRNGKWVGAETMRPLIARMPKDLAERYRARFETP